MPDIPSDASLPNIPPPRVYPRRRISAQRQGTSPQPSTSTPGQVQGQQANNVTSSGTPPPSSMSLSSPSTTAPNTG